MRVPIPRRLEIDRQVVTSIEGVAVLVFNLLPSPLNRTAKHKWFDELYAYRLQKIMTPSKDAARRAFPTFHCIHSRSVCHANRCIDCNYSNFFSTHHHTFQTRHVAFLGRDFKVPVDDAVNNG